MTTGRSAAVANAHLDADGAAYPWIKLHVGDPGAAGTANPAANTTREQVTWNAASGGSMTNATGATWAAVPAAEDYTHFSAWSASTAGTFGFSGTVTANPVAAGDDAPLAAGALTVTEPVAG